MPRAYCGYAEGPAAMSWLDEAMMRMVDILASLPYMFIVILCTSLLGHRFFLLFIVLGVLGWLTMARVVRSQTLALRERDFVRAARACGTPEYTILYRHLLPHLWPTIFCIFTLQTPSLILEEAFLSFIGLGVQPPRPSLGALIAEGSRHMTMFLWELLFPIAVLTLLLATLQYIGEYLQKNLMDSP